MKLCERILALTIQQASDVLLGVVLVETRMPGRRPWPVALLSLTEGIARRSYWND